MLSGNWSRMEEVESRDGIFRQVFTAGNLQVVRYRHLPGSVYGSHSHPGDQMTIVLAGSLEFDIAGEKLVVGPDDLAHIPGGVPHGATTLGDEEAVTLNFFSPPKKGF